MGKEVFNHARLAMLPSRQTRSLNHVCLGQLLEHDHFSREIGIDPQADAIFAIEQFRRVDVPP